MFKKWLKYPFKVGSIDIKSLLQSSEERDFAEIIEIYPQQEVFFPAPNTLEDEFPEQFTARTELIPPMYVLKLRNGKCFTKNGFILTHNNKPITDFIPQNEHPLRKKRFHKFESTEFIKGSVVVLTNDSCQKNYYHWLIESASRLHLIEKSGFKPDKYVINSECSYQKDVLNILGIKQSQIIEITPNRLIQAENLLVPSIINYFKEVNTEHRTYFNAKFIPKWALDFYREKLNTHISLKSTKKIYISRGKATYRSVTNEQEVINHLKNRGFEIVFPEDLDFIGQAELFYNANTVISVHGAGLTNLMFCREGTKVIEFFDRWYLYQGQQMIAQQLNLDYTFAFSELKDFRFGAGFGAVEISIDKLDKISTHLEEKNEK